MEKVTNMEQEKLLEVLKNYKNKSNKDLISALDFLYDDFNKTKDLLVKLTHHLDSTEISYNKLLEEINKRTNND